MIAVNNYLSSGMAKSNLC